jgi:hypothetical protein
VLMNIKETSIKDLIDYDILTGAFYILKNNTRYRRIFPSEDGYLIFYRNKRRIKLKANKAAIDFVNESNQINQYNKDNPDIITKVVLHKNLNEDDYRYCNLRLISKKVYNIIKEAHRNLSGALKLQPHSKDVFSYVLTWKENSKDKVLVVQDVVIAKRLYNKLQLKYAKILNKFCIFD